MLSAPPVPIIVNTNLPASVASGVSVKRPNCAAVSPTALLGKVPAGIGVGGGVMLSLIVPVAAVGSPSVIRGLFVLPNVTMTVSLSSTIVSSVVGTVMVAVVAPAGINTLVVVFV